LEKLHTKVHSTEARYDERDDYCWELQRVVTELKRKKKVFEQLSASKMGDEQEFMKALILMAATLQAENYELKANNSYLKEQIRTEAELVESYKVCYINNDYDILIKNHSLCYIRGKWIPSSHCIPLIGPLIAPPTSSVMFVSLGESL
jgi:hypothetical protein